MITHTLFFLIVLVALTRAYNLDFEYSVTKKGPANSLFGFSVAEHLNENKRKNLKETWILVGAPKANNTALSSVYKESGTVFKCRADDPSAVCTEEVVFDRDVDGTDTMNKADEWMGVSLKSGGPNNEIVTCAHRYESYGPGNNFRLLLGECYGATKSFRPFGKYTPCQNEKIGDRQPDHSSYGQCQSGIGVDVLPKKFIPEDDDKSYLLVGAAGARWFSGEFFQMDTESETKSKGSLPKDVQIDIDQKNLLDYRSSYFGYSIAYGNFFNEKDAYVASGGPRHKHYGKVLIYERIYNTKTKQQTNKIVQDLPNNEKDVQIASGYGISLCSIDSDNNGVSELIVGAPFYLSLDGKERAEQGRVYVYTKSETEKKLVLKGLLQGEDKSYSRFGYAVANGGDANLDNYEDLVVGAPREDGKGAVYIFYGSKNGFVQTNSQRIAAVDVVSGLTESVGLEGFGRSLGTGVDMDFNGYKDILVGAYISNQVALLRTRPVIQIDSKLEFEPKELDAGQHVCDLTKPSSCTTAKLCFTITEPSGNLQKNNKSVTVRYTIEADPVRGSLRKSRMNFDDNGINKKTVILTSKVGQFTCKELGKLGLKFDDDGSIIEYPDVMFKVTYEMPYGDAGFVKPTRTNTKVVSLDDYPVLQRNMDGTGGDNQLFMTAKLTFKRNCTTCIPDLQLTTDNTSHTIRRGMKTYSFKMNLKNIGEDLAYSVVLEFRLPKTLTLNNMKIEGRTHVNCQKNVCQNVVTRLRKGEMRAIEVFLATDDFEDNYSELGENNITVIVRSANAEAPGTTDNNKLLLNFDLKVVADLRLYSQQGNTLSYEGQVKGESAMTSLEDIGPYVTHKYIVQNAGPDELKMANLTIKWPYQTYTGKHLLYVIQVDTGVEKDIVCAPGVKQNILNLKSDGSAVDSSRSHSPIQDPPVIDTTTSAASAAAAAAMVASKKKRVRRSTETENVAMDEPETAAASKKRGIELNCTTAECIDIKCTLSNLKNQDKKVITIRSVLWKPSLMLDYKGEQVTVVSEGVVIGGNNASYIKDLFPYNQDSSVFNNVLPVAPKVRQEKILVWQIGLAVAAGVILLALMIFGLYKVGFFRRSRTFDESNGANEKLIKGRKE